MRCCELDHRTAVRAVTDLTGRVSYSQPKSEERRHVACMRCRETIGNIEESIRVGKE
jgi:hypothetical protein